MNLWGRLAGISFLALIVLFGCKEDDISLLGFKKTDDKFKVIYQEVGVNTSVMAIDSIRTYNNFTLPYPRRLLVGKYQDDKFGQITAEAYTQFQPLVPTISISEKAKFVSAHLVLSYDFYLYGDDQISTSRFTVHELLDSLPPVFDPTGALNRNVQAIPNYQPYYFNSSKPYDPTPIGSVDLFNINPLSFEQLASDIASNSGNQDPKTIDSLNIPLSASFGGKLFFSAKEQTNEYKVWSRFRRNYKGLVIRPGDSDTKVIGFNPAIDSTKFAKSRIILFYDEPDAISGLTVRKKLEYSLFGAQSQELFGFSHIVADRSTTVLGGLSNIGVEAELDGNRYIQSGNPITTKINFDKFLEFADTIPNLIFNFVELSIDAEEPNTYQPPSVLRLRYLNSVNEFVYTQSLIQEESTLPIYPSMTYDEEGLIIIGKRFDGVNINPVSDLRYNSETKNYSGDLTDFFQSLYNFKDTDFRYTDFALVAASPPAGLSVNRVIFNKDNIKLKLIYTIPTANK